MKIIVNANETVLEILKTFKKTDSCSRMMKYCVHTPVEDGVLLFNLLTREMLLLSEEEFNHMTELEYLKDQWFVVPEGTNEKEYVDFVKLYLTARQKKSDVITGYTIFPTTDCNARCFYCFELTRSRINMSHETALKVVQYIKNHCGGEKINISWFGGEPLFHQDAIDTICDGLRQEGVEFTSNMVSNGYLFDDATVKKAVERWNLKKVQITLDGTEAVYNKIKAFIYREESPYQIVLNNIEHLLADSVIVSIRLNVGLHNAEDLLVLVDELASRFGGREKLRIYAHHLFKSDQPDAQSYSDEEWAELGDAMRRLEEKICLSGLASKVRLPRKIKTNFCMADSDRSVTILPDGNLGKCEHFSETEFVGHIDREGFDADMVASWKETMPAIPECAECFYYPACIKLKKCSNQCECYQQYREQRLRRTCREMVSEYQIWQTKTVQEEDEELTQD